MPQNNRRYLQATSALEKRYKPAIQRIIQKFRKEFIRRYKANPQAARNELSSILLNEDIAKVLRSIYRTAGLMGARMLWGEQKQYLTQKDMYVIYRTKAGGFGRNETWIRDVLKYLELHGLEMVSKVTETMKADILKILQKAIDEGWGIDETVRQLQTRYVLPRAKLMARTEINNATNAGHRIAAESLPYEVDKEWVAAKDERTRPGHRDVNGHVVDENGLFKVPVYKGDVKTGYEEMEGPGDPNASVGNLANCRCRRIYRPKRDASGRLVLRRPNQARIIPMRRPQQVDVGQIAAILKSQIHIGVD